MTSIEPVVIDQMRLNPPGIRPQEWWDRFLPDWARAVVKDDNTVEITPNPRPRFILCDADRQAHTPAAQRKRAGWVRRFVDGCAPLRDAIVSGSAAEATGDGR